MSSVNGFDLAVLAIVGFGVWRGRKQGMSEELLSLLKWASIVVGCAVCYEPVAHFFSETNRVFSMLTCYLMAYIAVALAIIGVFALIKRSFGGKLLGSDIFGRAEYYLGMGSGLVRFSCILVTGLALLNARAYTTAEVRDMQAFQKEEFGSEYFPTLQTVQATVFEQSFTGPWIRDNLAFLLIKSTQPERKQFHQQEFTLP